MAAKGDALVSLNAHLQDDINVIEDMVREFHRGHQVVLGVRKRRQTDSIFKRTMARAFYRLLKIFGVEIVENHADFRLMGRAAVEALREFGEVTCSCAVSYPCSDSNPQACTMIDESDLQARASIRLDE